MFDFIRQDLKAYRNTEGKRQWTEPSLACVILYRIGYAIRQIRFRPLRLLLIVAHYPFFYLCNLIVGIYIPCTAKIGAGLRIYHYGCIFLNSYTVMGRNCILRQGVTIGVKTVDGGAPVIGNNVEFGAGSKVLGDLRVGDNVTIGANAVVICDIPDNSIAVGVPAKFYTKKK